MKQFAMAGLSSVLFVATASSQTGQISYDRAVKYSYEIPEQARNSKMFAGLPTADVSTMVLQYSPTATRMIMDSSVGADEEQAAVVLSADRMNIESAQMKAMVIGRMKMSSTSRGDHEEMLDAYTDLQTGAFTEIRKFITRTFRLTGPRPTYPWKLSGEQSEFLGLPVMKATAEYDGSVIEAWFTPAIPISGGPGPYGGLPGMILALTVDEDQLVYSATKIEQDAVIGEIPALKEGKVVTREEYEKIVADKLDELKSSRRGRQVFRRDGN